MGFLYIVLSHLVTDSQFFGKKNYRKEENIEHSQLLLTFLR